ncbi:serine hydrolase domain-containing protein [Sedimentitalea nanhaiensis]|uniref:CubicO group peptidase, beta-lactamase class C family n=1 Tax=Sedimentitalea nanhaiensis TaxID=999627 RepID=A0A1I7DAR1_9RHOB|nr:serine hydrolase [Sedimentitalea nanhaiensis]SFU08771.1 CubicO group peptidase, beta-lactamase class C family [Sedimentitalea nanhaiensis]
MNRSYRNCDPTPPIMQGSPVPPEWRIPPQDWDAPPWNRWAFQHMRELVTTVDVPRGPTVWDLPGAGSDVDAVAFSDNQGGATTWGRMLDDTYTDATLIWLDGQVVVETYCNGMTPRRPHIAFSVSKSIVAAAAGVLIGDGLLDPAAPIAAYVPELAATGWNGASLQQVLDMTTGVVFDETYGAFNSNVLMLDIAANVKPPSPHMDPATLPGCTWDLILSLTQTEAVHGDRFSYRSIETDVLGYAMERASGKRLPDLVSDLLWAPMGAEQDAFFTVDRAGFALADGGCNAVLRDLARFGRLLLEDGQRDGQQIVPLAWINDIRGGNHGLFDDHGRIAFPNGQYRNQFWIPNRDRPAHLSLGIFGQHIFVDPDQGLVAVKLSSWPDFLSDKHWTLDWLAGVRAVAAAHKASG